MLFNNYIDLRAAVALHGVGLEGCEINNPKYFWGYIENISCVSIKLRI